MKCNRDCFHCKYEDCIVDDVTITERIDQMERDINTQTENNIGKYANKRAKKNYGNRVVWNG